MTGGTRGTGDCDGRELGFSGSGLLIASVDGAELIFERRGAGGGGVGLLWIEFCRGGGDGDFSIGFSLCGGGDGVRLLLIFFSCGVIGAGVFSRVLDWTSFGDNGCVFFPDSCLTGVVCLFGLGDFFADTFLTGVGSLGGVDGFFGGGGGKDEC